MVVGDAFHIICGVRQGSVLSPVLFLVYLDNVIDDLRKSGNVLHIGTLFMGCIVYADNIMLLSCSCHGIQSVADICNECGQKLRRMLQPTQNSVYYIWCNNPKALNITLI